jgi:hypothetical protein
MDQLGHSGQTRKDHAKWKGEAFGDASNGQTFVQPNRGKSLVMRRVGSTGRIRLGTIAGSARFDRVGGAPYR